MLDRMLLAAGGEEKLYVEDVFSTYLYTGNGSTQTITNGIDLAGKGGLIWLKSRSGSGYNHVLTDTVRGVNATLVSNSAAAQFTASTLNWAFSSSGFSFNNSFTDWNANGATYASWTFRKAPQFFDVVTWNGNGAYGRTISHNLGVAPGCIIIKHTSGPYASGNNWVVWHRSDPANVLALNTTGAAVSGSNKVLAAGVTATSFQLGGDSTVNREDGTYVAYLFAHDATADGIIQCGSFTTDGSDNATVNLGWEPQFVMVKQSSATSDWAMLDTMRGWPVTASDAWLRANSSAAENIETTDYISPTSTGFQVKGMWGTPGGTSVYIAIRRGPMKTPTVGTSVFAPITYAGNSTAGTVRTTGIVTDMVWSRARANVNNEASYDRLRGAARRIETTTTSAETTEAATAIGLSGFDRMDGYVAGADQGSASINFSGRNHVNWSFRRAPGFFDVVCYTGINSTRTINHNLGVPPELIIVKNRGASADWPVWHSLFSGTNDSLALNTTGAKSGSGLFTTTAPTATVFSVAVDGWINSASNNYVAYLFASCPGVSKVGSYTGNGSSQTINCGFSNGARFFLVKRTDSTGDWWVYDSARGIVAAADPALRLNSTAAEVTSADAVDTDSTGIIVNQEATCNINVNGATYIYLAIA